MYCNFNNTSTDGKNHPGFTLVEIAVVLTIIGVLATLAAPMIRNSKDAAESQIVINDLRIFAEAYNRYNLEKQEWPATPELGEQFPVGMTGYLGTSGWERENPYKGDYRWYRDLLVNDVEITAFISIGTETATLDEIRIIDETIDDGDIYSGQFRIGFRNDPMLILEE